MMRTLVTGAGGLIGGAVSRRLQTRGHDVTAVDITDHGAPDSNIRLAPLEDFDSLSEAVGDEALEAVVHCGAISGPMLAKGNPMAIVQANVLGLANVLELARQHEVKRFVFCSSIGVYGNAPGGPGPEHHHLQPASVYGGSKAAGEDLITGFSVEYGLSAISFRIARVYGPGRRGNCHIKTIIEHYLKGEPIVIPCDPNFVYHYVFIDDVVDGIETALDASWSGHGIFNISGPQPQTMPEIVNAIRSVLPDVDIRLVPGTDDVPDIQHWFSLQGAHNALGWTPKRSIADGVRAYTEYLAPARR